MVFLGEQQREIAARADAANANGFDDAVLQPIAIEEHAPLVRKRLPIRDEALPGALLHVALQLVNDQSKIRRRSTDANSPKFSRWQSPHTCTRTPVDLVFARS
jgi:hypothetical protein